MSERCACVFVSRIKRHGRYTLAALCQYKVPPWYEVLWVGEGPLYIVYGVIQWGGGGEKA